MREQYLHAVNYADYGIMAQSGVDAGAAIAASLRNRENAARPLEEQGFDTGKHIEQL
jgi:hypothetical protein